MKRLGIRVGLRALRSHRAFSRRVGRRRFYWRTWRSCRRSRAILLTWQWPRSCSIGAISAAHFLDRTVQAQRTQSHDAHASARIVRTCFAGAPSDVTRCGKPHPHNRPRFAEDAGLAGFASDDKNFKDDDGGYLTLLLQLLFIQLL